MDNIISYAIKLYKDSIIRKLVTDINDDTFIALDIRKMGAETILEKLEEFNEIIPIPLDVVD